MKFTLSAGGAQAAGNGIGNIFKAYMMGPQVRQQAEQDTAAKLAQIYANNMQGNKYGAEAEGLSMTNTARKAPIDPTLSRYMQDAYKLFQATGDGNMERFANAGTALQTQGIRDQALGNVADVDTMNRYNTLAKPGETYMPFKAVGDTGAAVDQATGDGAVFDEVLRKLFSQESGAKVLRDQGAANSSNAAAGKYSADARQTDLETGILGRTGAKPGAGREASEGALSSTILRTLQIPALDERGRAVRNPITGEQETTTDLAAMTRFYEWLDADGRKPTATAFAQWEARGRPSANKSPAPGQATPKMGASAALEKAREALAKGAPRDKVIERLRKNGIDPTGL